MTRTVIARGLGTSPAGPPGPPSTVPGPQGDDGPQGPRGLPGVNAVENDEAVATYIADPESQVASALSTSYGAPATGVRTAAITDSIGVFNGDGGDQQGDSYLAHAVCRSRQRVLFAGTHGTGGFTLEQIEATHLPAVLADPTMVGGECIVSGGTNNMGDAEIATGLATLRRICAALEAGGIRPRPITVPPRSDDANARVLLWNTAVRQIVQTRNYRLLDVHTAAVDPATGGWKSGYSSDGIHPSRTGARQIGEALALDIIAENPTAPRLLPTHALVGSNRHPNSLFLVTGGSATGHGSGQTYVPAGWDLLTNGTDPTTLPALTDDGEGGKWWDLHPAGTNLLLQYNAGDVTVTPGRRYAFTIGFKATGYEATDGNADSGPSFNIGCEVRSSGGSNLRGLNPVSGWRRGHGTAECVAYMEFVAPTGAATVRVNVSSDQADGATLSLRRPAILDLSNA